MKRLLILIFLLACLTINNTAISQSQRPKKHNHPSGKVNAIAAGANLPLGHFSSTHIIGAVADYSWTDHRFGGMDIKPVRPLGFMADAGLAYYFGKKETASGYPYDYPGYIFLRLGAGVIYNPWKKGNINITIGPALGIYNGHSQFNIGGKLEGSYYIGEKIGISPGIIFMKEHGANPLVAASLKATMVF